MRDWFESMFVAYALVFECDASFAAVPLVLARAKISSACPVPSDLSDIPILIPFLLGPAGSAFVFLFRLRHSARRSVFLVEIQLA